LKITGTGRFVAGPQIALIFATEPARRAHPLKAGKTTLQPMNLNPEEETHAKDAMHAKEGIYERYSTHHWGDTFSI